jgi:hypothetical protein
MEPVEEMAKQRLGRHEKKIIENLQSWKNCNPQWDWHPNSGYLSKLADEDDIAAYSRGRIVPVWMLRRDCVSCKATLSRSLRTLAMKGLVSLRAGWLDTKYDAHRDRQHTKFVSLR